MYRLFHQINIIKKNIKLKKICIWELIQGFFIEMFQGILADLLILSGEKYFLFLFLVLFSVEKLTRQHRRPLSANQRYINNPYIYTLYSIEYY